MINTEGYKELEEINNLGIFINSPHHGIKNNQNLIRMETTTNIAMVTENGPTNSNNVNNTILNNNDSITEDIYEELCTLKRNNTFKNNLPAPQCKRDHCFHELLNTETNYVKALKDVVKDFLDKIRPVLSHQDINKIFGRIEDIIGIHDSFLEQLTQTIPYESSTAFLNNSSINPKLNLNFNDKNHDTLSVGQVFLQYMDQFMIYGEYCVNLGPAIKHLTHLIATNEKFSTVFWDCQNKATQAKFHLRDLIALPLQRILRYHILLKGNSQHNSNIWKKRKDYIVFSTVVFSIHYCVLRIAHKIKMYTVELKRYTPVSTSSYDVLAKALEQILDLTEHLNELKRDIEALQKSQTLQRKLVVDPSPYPLPFSCKLGRLYTEGELKIKSTHDSRLKLRYAFLFDQSLIYCKLPKLDKYGIKEQICLKNFRLEIPNKNLTTLNGYINANINSPTSPDSNDITNIQQHSDDSYNIKRNKNGYQNQFISWLSSVALESCKNNREQSPIDDFMAKIQAISSIDTTYDYWRQQFKKTSKWAYPWVMISNKNPGCIYNMYAKSFEIYVLWLVHLIFLQDNLKPGIWCNPSINYNAIKNHQFNIHTFTTNNFNNNNNISNINNDMRCDFCHLLLKGYILQGYKCQNCEYKAHKQCLPLLKTDCPGDASNKHGKMVLNLAEKLDGLIPFSDINCNNNNKLFGTRKNINNKNKLKHDSNVSKSSPKGILESPNHLNAIDIVDKPIMENIDKNIPIDDELFLRIPQNNSWFMGYITRDQAKRILLPLQSGTFLVRQSVQNDNYVLSLKYLECVKHIVISQMEKRTDDDNNHCTTQYYIASNHNFDSLSNLITYYQSHTLADLFKNLNTKLLYPYNNDNIDKMNGNTVQGPNLNLNAQGQSESVNVKQCIRRYQSLVSNNIAIQERENKVLLKKHPQSFSHLNPVSLTNNINNIDINPKKNYNGINIKMNLKSTYNDDNLLMLNNMENTRKISTSNPNISSVENALANQVDPRYGSIN